MGYIDYTPMLIVAKDENNNYVPLRKSDKNKKYYCPCCGKKVKARALYSEKVQPHYYHFEGNECDNETIKHWIYKNWLFDKGSKFVISNDNGIVEYTVNNIDIEKSYKTKFGIYRPDITVYTNENKIFYFEINYTNKKDIDDFSCKWNELGNDVVEVNVKELLHSDYEETIPSFNTIYINGEYCKKFKEQKERDFYSSNISKYKDKIKETNNYIKRFESLDNFWICLTKYRNMKVGKEEIIKEFESLDYYDMTFCYNICKKIKLKEILSDFERINNNRFNELIKDIDYKPYLSLDFNQESPRIFYIGFLIKQINDFKLYKGFYINGNKDKFIDFEVFDVIKNAINDKDFTKDFEKEDFYCEEEVRFIENLPTRIYRGKRNYVYTVGYSYPNSLSCSDDWYWFKIKTNRYNFIQDKKQEEEKIKINNIFNSFSTSKKYLRLCQSVKNINDGIDINIIKNVYNISVDCNIDNLKIYSEYINSDNIFDCEDFLKNVKNNFIEYEDANNIKKKLKKELDKIIKEINECKNKLWKIKYTFADYDYKSNGLLFNIEIIFNEDKTTFYIYKKDIEKITVKEYITELMNEMWNKF